MWLSLRRSELSLQHYKNYNQDYRMKAAKIVGAGLLLGVLCPDLRKSASLSQILNSQPGQIISDRFGNKIALAFCTVSLIGGVAYCVYRYLRKDKANVDQLRQISPEELLKKLQSQQLAWEISSISTNTANETYEELICGITNELMVDPVNLPCCHEFSRKAVEQWLTKNESCPKCRQPAKIGDIRASLVTRKTIERFKKKMMKKGQQWVMSRIRMDFQNEIIKPPQDLLK